ncbi:MAG: PAS domain S-box protein [Nitrospirales bacterium]|nr:PAS domain S-box protein [Nitrospira sp.]MDR4502530.1 PAS domain S-box protein [Nitrospirales bacterium]
MSPPSHDERLRQELETLRTELAELRAVQRRHEQTEAGLQALELQLAGIIHSAMDAIITVDAEQRVVLFNVAAEKMFGYQAADMLGAPLDRLIPVRSRPAHQHYIHQFSQNHKTGRRVGNLGAISGLRANGEEFPIEASISHAEVGGDALFTVILRDISERVKSKTMLQETQRTLTTLIKHLSGMVYRCRNDRDWSMLFVSEGCQQLTGYLPEEFLEQGTVSYGRDVILKDDRERIWQEVQAANAKGSSYQLSYRIKTVDGSIKWVWEQGSGVAGHDQTVHALEGYVFDITQEKILEDRLRKTERLAELGTLASGMAHEIGTPMNVILGRAEYLMRKTTDGKAKEGLTTIITQVERITKIMNQLLSFARKRPIERSAIHLKAVLDNVFDIMHERFIKHGIGIELIAKDHVPSVFADADQLSQVFLNISINACHAMANGGMLTTVIQKSGHHVCVSISDTGEGIPAENLSRLFDPFFTTKPVGEGTGLGLTVVHGIIQEHDGRITVESELGQGTTFHIFLPIYPLSK